MHKGGWMDSLFTPSPLLSKSSHGGMWLMIDVHHLQQTAVCVSTDPQAYSKEYKAMMTPFMWSAVPPAVHVLLPDRRSPSSSCWDGLPRMWGLGDTAVVGPQEALPHSPAVAPSLVSSALPWDCSTTWTPLVFLRQNEVSPGKDTLGYSYCFSSSFSGGVRSHISCQWDALWTDVFQVVCRVESLIAQMDLMNQTSWRKQRTSQWDGHLKLNLIKCLGIYCQEQFCLRAGGAHSSYSPSACFNLQEQLHSPWLAKADLPPPRLWRAARRQLCTTQATAPSFCCCAGGLSCLGTLSLQDVLCRFIALHPISPTYKVPVKGEDAPGFTTPSPGSEQMILNTLPFLFPQDFLLAVMNLCWSPISAFHQQHVQPWRGEAYELLFLYAKKKCK